MSIIANFCHGQMDWFGGADENTLGIERLMCGGMESAFGWNLSVYHRRRLGALHTNI